MTEWKECKDHMSREAFAEQYVLERASNHNLLFEDAKNAMRVWDLIHKENNLKAQLYEDAITGVKK